MTPAQALATGAARLRAAGVPDPAGDARRLLAHALGCEPARLILRTEPLSDAEKAIADVVFAARAARQPVAQITGTRAFWRHDFRVTRDTLDPRPETETLVQAALALPWRSVLDLGTGTGAILISLLAARPGGTGTGTDLSSAALAVARGNAARIGVTATFRQADWWHGLPPQTFDLIVSNPPYIAAAEMPALGPEVRDWEPALALTDGADGLTAYRTIAAGLDARLAPGGTALVEIGSGQGAAVTAIFRACGFTAAILPDLDGRDRVVRARRA